MNDPLGVLNQLDRVRAETLHRLTGLTQDHLDWRPPANERETAWSLGEVFMHLALDEHYLRELIARPLLEGVKPPNSIQFIPPPPPYGAQKETILFWFERARLLTRRLLEDFPARANLELTHAGGLEPMNGLDWFEGYAGHEAIHHRQIDALIMQLNQGGTVRDDRSNSQAGTIPNPRRTGEGSSRRGRRRGRSSP